GKKKTTNLKTQVDMLKQQLRGNFAHMFNNIRNKWINTVVENTTKKQKIVQGQFSESFGRLSRHPVFGIPILAVVILVMYLLVVNVANVIAGWMDQNLWLPVQTKIDALVTVSWLNEFLIGDYGVLSLGLANAFLTILPILTVFFIAFNILEDIGYIPNLCVLTKRIFDKLGLSGGAIMPLVLGFGCKTMATLTTKSLRSKKERYIAIYLIAFAIPCAAQMALNMSILGRMGARAFVIAFSTLAFVEIAAGFTLNKILKEEERSDFLQELPAIRLPNPKAVIVKTYYRLWWFIKEAVPVFIYAAIVLFVIDKVGILNAVKNALEPVMGGLLGLPVQMVDALILCMARHEAAAGLIIKLIQAGQLNYIQCIVAVTITTMFVPCFANIMAMIKELGVKRALAMAVIINASAFFIAGALNWVLVLFFKL
ncbi:MAG: nucleoside recognition domain-containing protein, partial [Planctomycetota bacterium]